MTISKKLLAITAGAIVLAGMLGAFVLRTQFPVVQVNAFDNSNEVRGYAWSSNIGWISFNCADRGVCSSSPYKTTVDLVTGVLSGQAWSSNIGWIDINPAGVGSRPSDAYGMRINMTTGVVSGWMRASANGGGWDGWIKITDAKVGTGGIIRNGADTEGGWAWGGDVVGWMLFSNTSYSTMFPHADCDFSASPTVITLPQKSTLTWSCNILTTANTCAIDKGVGSGMPTNSTRQVAPPQGTTYTLTCQGLWGPVTKTTSVALTGETATGTIRIIEDKP